MFNDILTGKSTLEQEPEPKHPFRPDPGSHDLVCTSCQRTFPASQAMAGRCRACAPNVDAALGAMRGPKADYTDYGANDRGRDLGLTIVIVGVLIAAVLAMVYARVSMRQQTIELEYQYQPQPSSFTFGR